MPVDPVIEVLPPVNTREPIPPMANPVVVDVHQHAWLPHAFIPRTLAYRPVCRGAAIGWAPALEIGGIMLVFAGGNDVEPSDEAVVTMLSREGLRAIIAGLQSIDQQLGDAW